MTIPTMFDAELLAAARARHPQEACGLLLGREQAIASIRECANVHPQPERHFEIDPQALIDAHRAARSGGPEIVGYWHSHPVGPPEPSATDARTNRMHSSHSLPTALTRAGMAGPDIRLQDSVTA